MIKIETISLVALLILITFLEIMFQSSQINYLIGIRFSYVATLLFFFNDKYKIGITYLIVSSIVFELLLLHTLGISMLVFASSIFLINLVLKNIGNIKLEDSRYLTSILVFIVNPVLYKLFLKIIEQEDVSISVFSILLNILIFYFGVYILGKNNKRSSVYKDSY